MHCIRRRAIKQDTNKSGERIAGINRTIAGLQSQQAPCRSTIRYRWHSFPKLPSACCFSATTKRNSLAIGQGSATEDIKGTADGAVQTSFAAFQK